MSLKQTRSEATASAGTVASTLGASAGGMQQAEKKAPAQGPLFRENVVSQSPRASQKSSVLKIAALAGGCVLVDAVIGDICSGTSSGTSLLTSMQDPWACGELLLFACIALAASSGALACLNGPLRSLTSLADVSQTPTNFKKPKLQQQHVADVSAKGTADCRCTPTVPTAPTSQAIASAAMRKPGHWWNQALQDASRVGDTKKTVQLLSDLLSSGTKPDTISFNIAMKAFAKQGDYVGATKCFEQMEAAGVEPTTASYNTMMDVCVKGNQTELCETWLTRLEQSGAAANEVSYATAINARARQGDRVRCEALLRRMEAAGVQPDTFCYNALIHACGVKGDGKGALRWVDEMAKKGLEVSVNTFTAAIDACAKRGDVPGAEAWLEKMLAAGLEPNVVSFSTLIDACAKASDPKSAEKWHDRMVTAGVTPNAHSFSAIISAFARSRDAGAPEAAKRWLERAEAAGAVSDPVLYSGVIDAYSKAGDADGALAIFNKMRTNGVQPHVVAYAALARPFAHRGDWAKIEELARDMQAAGIASNEYFLYAQIVSYATARPKQPSRAEAAFRRAMEDGMAVNDHITSALVRALGKEQANSLLGELRTEKSRSTKAPKPDRPTLSAKGSLSELKSAAYLGPQKRK
eukprot:gnl/TRDRNA2_/TRDRNA2_178899_c0_seq1.p1 gnl/TRDRNA2_/TRDRNA2_178899_c0~~gnl/TRDRNA2_/TRDRNA2_178899_c0_seq1.p1  ORF type:complete len:637 (+),score=141.19 gnl/TRDRNA2_/TRDRNA2_178899_c0_seq1:94-2004(+)